MTGYEFGIDDAEQRNGVSLESKSQVGNKPVVPADHVTVINQGHEFTNVRLSAEIQDAGPKAVFEGLVA